MLRICPNFSSVRFLQDDSRKFLTPETRRGMGTSFRRNVFWDRLGGQALLMIGSWLP